MLKNFTSFLFFILILFSINVFPQYGKLTGKVVDAVTGEPIIGATVIVNGTTLGAAADVNGNYLILRVPAATYSITATSIGYQKVTVTNVEAIVDRTTEINFKMQDQSVQLEQVVIVAEKPKIIKDQTSSSSTISQEQIKAAPIEGIRGALDLSSGFQKTATGNYQVRGSGSYEVNFQINGVEQINSSTTSPASTPGSEKANNSWKFDVNPLGVSQVQLISGGFSAEYGNAQAGVVKVVLKEGTPKISGEFRVEYRPQGQYHFGDYLYSRNNYEWQKWGSLNNWMNQRGEVIKNLNIDKRYDYLYNYIKTHPNDSAAINQMTTIENNEIIWAYETWVKNHTPSKNSPLGIYDYTKQAYTRYLVGIGGPLGKDPNLLRFYFSGEYRKNPTRLPTPEQNQVYQNYIVNTTWQPFEAHKIKFMGSYQSYRGGIWSGSDDIRWSGIPFVPSGTSSKYYITVDPVRTELTVAQSLNWTYTVNPQSFVEATLSHQKEDISLPYEYLTNYDQMADRLDSLNDPQGSLLRSGPWWETAYYRPPFNVSTNYYQDSRSNNWNGSVDYTNQILKTNLLKAGVRFYYWDLFNNAVNSSFQANSYIARSGYAEYYHAYPMNVAFYLQDKMEYEGMVANLGLRAEAYNFQANVPIDPFNVFYQGKDGPGKADDPYGNPNTIPSETQYILLPRIGISFPIGESTAFRIQYGHFASMPIFAQGLSQRTDKGWLVRGNPNLNYKKTINYEFGLQQMLDETHRLDLALYYNDRVSQIGTQRWASFTGSTGAQGGVRGYTDDNIPLYPYTSYANNAYGSSIGFEVVFEKINYSEWSYRLSYSLSQTTEGNFGTEYIYPNNTVNQSRGFTQQNLGYSDRTHNFRGLLQYSLAEDEGAYWFGVYPFENSTLSLTYTAQSGLPYTYITSFDLIDVVNNRRYPLESIFDFNAVKNFDLFGYKIIMGLRIMNLFNNKWLTPFGLADDMENWVEKGVNLDDPGNDPTRKSYVLASFKAYRNIPRQVFFTLGIGF
ncbi:MAG TPA: TonB-dependent receptor [Ignavibacteriaceae bacterium]|nr:TonB-dependent receptor [Ignavibacteriaceae bacterium]